MISKQRVHNALARIETDRVPMWMWYHPSIYKQFHDRFGWDNDTTDLVLGNDIKSVHLGINREMFRDLAPGEKYTDAWGVTWIREGLYNQVCRNPLAESDVSAIAEYRFPDPEDEDRYIQLSRVCDTFGDEYFIGADVSGTIFEPCYHIRSMDMLMVDMLQDKDAVELFFDHAAEFTRRVCLHALDYCIDWIWLGDDVGGQNSMMLSPALWRELLKPRLASIIATVKEARPGIWIAYHSCGTVRPIIDDLIEIGVDVLNPIQPLCPGMDPLELKAEYGDKLAFMGAFDTQDLLINSTADVVRERAQELIAGMSKNGGYIFAASHTVQPDTPMENILACSQAVGVDPV